MVQKSAKQFLKCLLLVATVLSLSSTGTGSSTEEDFAAMEAELLKAGRDVFDSNKLHHLTSMDWSIADHLNVSGTCFKHSVEYVANVRRLLSSREITKVEVPVPLWSIKMFDAMGKFPTGLLEMNTKWIGSFSECLNIKTKHQEVNFSGQYCTIFFENATETEDSKLARLLVQTGTSMGICWPSTCNETEVEIMINALDFIQLPVNRVVRSGYCQTDAPADFDAATISVITLFAVFIVLLVVATVYDIYKRRRKKYHQLKTEEEDDDGVDLEDSKPGVCHKVLVCFSVYSNGKLLPIAEDPCEKALGCIHGIRVFSILWAILLRICSYATIMPIKDFKDVIASVGQWGFDVILNATFCYDSMLFASGFCVAYSLLFRLKKSGGCIKDFVHYYVHGFMRVTPVLAMSVAFLAGPYYLLASGPQWPDMKVVQTACRTDWWKTLLYINNLFDTQDLCVEVSWYTSLEMQFYVVAPLIIYPLYRWPIVGYVIGGLFCLATTLAPALLVHYKDLPGFPNTFVIVFPLQEYSKAYNVDVYMKPWCRMGPYMVGIGLAYFLYRKDMKVKMKLVFVWLGWMLAVALALALIYGNFGYFALQKSMSDALSSAYAALSRPAWALCIAWIVLVCSTGNAGYSGHFLSWRMFLSISHFSYSLNMVHLYVALAFIETYEASLYFQTYFLAIVYIGVTFVSIGISSIFYFLFEAPVVQLEKTFVAPEVDPPSRRPSTPHET